MNILLTKKIDSDVAYLFGSLIGDGCIKQYGVNYKIIFISKDDEYLDLIKNILEKIIELKLIG